MFVCLQMEQLGGGKQEERRELWTEGFLVHGALLAVNGQNLSFLTTDLLLAP